MSWIQTYSGKQFFPLAPSAESIDIEDVARSLSFLCRFNGHCRTFYTVAEHSLRISRIVSPENALWGLLHDAAEAYVTDVPRPIKAELDVFIEMEDRILKVIVEVFGLSWPMPDDVREADDILLATEARDLMAPPPASWGLRAQPLEETIQPMSSAEARGAFLARYHELTR